MKAVRIHQYGGPEVLRYEEAPLPEPGPGDVRIRVRAAGVNPVDWKIREGYRREMLKHRLPLIPGWDVSGVVEGVGPGASRWKPGDEVFGRPDLMRDGAYAEYMVARETEIAAKPGSLDHVHSAAIPLASLTAWQSLFGAAGLARGQTVLVHAAAGGVGHLAVQLAKWKGARVVGTCSAANAPFVRDLGADEAIDYAAARFEEVVRDADVVFDTLGGDVQRRSWKALKPGGVLVSIVAPPPTPPEGSGLRGEFVFVQPNAAQLAEIASLADAGILRPAVESVLPLARAREAQRISQSGHVRGKIVLTVP